MQLRECAHKQRLPHMVGTGLWKRSNAPEGGREEERWAGEEGKEREGKKGKGKKGKGRAPLREGSVSEALKSTTYEKRTKCPAAKRT